ADSFIDTVAVPPNGAWIEYDLTDIVNDEMDNDGILSLRLTAYREGATLHAYSSKEEGGLTNEPHLAYNLIPGGTPEIDPCAEEPTSTEERYFVSPEDEPAFALMPNPVQDLLEISFDHDLHAREIHLLSVTGEILRTYLKATGQASLTIRVSDLARGMYFVRIDQHTQRFIKL
ncbi:MAG TPA: T9SS type A sorting domain-containing protein, partial [Saprospiraceae bacterium]|nr:T9SS type A sorting domain-containing protein [Saprospiraceae bacterium]